MTLIKNKMFSYFTHFNIIPLLILGFWVLIPKFLETPKFTIRKNNIFKLENMMK